MTEIKKIKSSSKERIHGPDVVRGLAATGVVFFHVLYMSGIEHSLIMQWAVGRFDFFVRIFFMISAFSMSYVYYDNLNSMDDIRKFYLKRFLRIAPLFYFVIFINCILIYFTEGNFFPLSLILVNLSFLFQLIPGMHNSIVGGGWSIGVEMLFYALFPLIISICRSLTKSFFLFLITLCLSQISKNYIGTFNNDVFTNFSLLNISAHLHYFIVGIIAFHVWRLKKTCNNHRVNSIVFITSTLSIIFLFAHKTTLPEEYFISTFGFLMIYSSASGLSRWLDNSLTRRLGTISYSVYLMQFPVISIFLNIGLYDKINAITPTFLDACFISAIITILSVIIISEITYRYVEVGYNVLYNRYLTRN